MFPVMHLSGSGSGQWTLTLSAREANVDLKAKLTALWGSMSSAVDAVVTVESGVEIYSTSAATAAMRTGTGWPSGSTLKIINRGKIRGKGGQTSSMNADNVAGGGGDAIEINIAVSIDNTSGYIFAGGGRGGAGGTGQGYDLSFWAGGGGPGGGQGDEGGSGGDGAAGDGVEGGDGEAGQSGSASAPGAGGAGGAGGLPGGSGGRGGYWGEYGASGDTGSGPFGTSGSSGAAPGRAVRRNSKTVTWLGGNNATRVKGAVS